MPNQDTPTQYPNWKATVTFDDHGPSPTTLLETDHLKAVLVGLKAGQSIPIHPSPEAVYHFLQGVGTMTCLLYTSPSPRDGLLSRMPSSA